MLMRLCLPTVNKKIKSFNSNLYFSKAVILFNWGKRRPFWAWGVGAGKPGASCHLQASFPISRCNNYCKPLRMCYSFIRGRQGRVLDVNSEGGSVSDSRHRGVPGAPFYASPKTKKPPKPYRRWSPNMTLHPNSPMSEFRWERWLLLLEIYPFTEKSQA